MDIKKGMRVRIDGGSKWYYVARVGECSVQYVTLHGFNGIVLFNRISEIRG